MDRVQAAQCSLQWGPTRLSVCPSSIFTTYPLVLFNKLGCWSDRNVRIQAPMVPSWTVGPLNKAPNPFCIRGAVRGPYLPKLWREVFHWAVIYICQIMASFFSSVLVFVYQIYMPAMLMTHNSFFLFLSRLSCSCSDPAIFWQTLLNKVFFAVITFALTPFTSTIKILHFTQQLAHAIFFFIWICLSDVQGDERDTIIILSLKMYYFHLCICEHETFGTSYATTSYSFTNLFYFSFLSKSLIRTWGGY